MNQEPGGNDAIRITREEALDRHVDDLLQRQASLRGDPGVSRDTGRRWYYQNWFVFMLVGALGAAAAWALLEPMFDDLVYYQGEITALDLDAAPPALSEQLDAATLTLAFRGSMRVRDQEFYVLRDAREIIEDGSRRRLNRSTLAVGDEVGVYARYERGADYDLAAAVFLVRDPPPQSASRAALTIEQLGTRSATAGFILFPLVSGFIGLFIGASDGIVCRLPRRALICGGVGLLVGLVGGFVCGFFADIAYGAITLFAERQSEGDSGLSTLGFSLQMIGRSLAWGLTGFAMGLGQGIALRSSRLLVYGMIGGIIGGLLGGLLFDPIDIIMLGRDHPSAHWSRLIGFVVIGGSVGGTIGLVELLARDAWLRMTQGPLTGKEFLIFKEVMNVGASPRSEIYLFNDPEVAEHHAVIRALGDACEIEARSPDHPVQVNKRNVNRARLRHGDTVTIGRTSFIFQQRKG